MHSMDLDEIECDISIHGDLAKRVEVGTLLPASEVPISEWSYEPGSHATASEWTPATSEDCFISAQRELSAFVHGQSVLLFEVTNRTRDLIKSSPLHSIETTDMA